MVDEQKYCPKCGAYVPGEAEEDSEVRVKRTETYLKLTDCEDMSKQYEVLLAQKVVIGRGSTADLDISDNKFVSRKNSMVYQKDEAHYIIDLDSMHHTCCNGRTLKPGESIRLKGGMTLGLGKRKYRLSFEERDVIMKNNASVERDRIGS